MSSRPRRAAPSALNTPVLAHVTGVKPIDQARAEAILTKFISTSEVIAASGLREDVAFTRIGLSNASGNNPILGQLKRVQRDLRGLPPLSAELDTSKRSAEDSAEEPRNKKIKFDDEDDSTVPEDKPADESNDDMSVEESEPIDEKASEADHEAQENTKEENEVALENLGKAEPEEAVTDDEEKRERKRQKKLAKKEKKEKKEKKKQH